jgi:hypothetical protein
LWCRNLLGYRYLMQMNCPQPVLLAETINPPLLHHTAKDRVEVPNIGVTCVVPAYNGHRFGAPPKELASSFLCGGAAPCPVRWLR